MQWDNTAGVWARGALQHYYGVDLKRINWLAARVKKEGVAEGIRIEQIAGDGDADHILDNLLITGKIDAVIGPNLLPSISARDPRTRRLFRDYRSRGAELFPEDRHFSDKPYRYVEAGVCRSASGRAGGIAQSVSQIARHRL